MKEIEKVKRKRQRIVSSLEFLPLGEKWYYNNNSYCLLNSAKHIMASSNSCS